MIARTQILLFALLLTLGLYTGCESSLPNAEQRIYPAGAETVGDLDVVVQRDGFWNATVTNRSAQKLENITLWINEEFGLPIASISPGQQINVDLTKFSNHYGETYPTGNFISPKKSQPIIKANVEKNETIYRCVVVLSPEWQNQY